jgi:hypothetical protein
MDINILLEKKKNFNRSTNYANIFTDEELKSIFYFLLKENENGKSFLQIQKEFGITRESIRNFCKKINYKIKNFQNMLRCREDLFLEIKTEEDAYWLGFIYADGYISDDGKFELSLNYRDYEHLLKFAAYSNFCIDKVIKKQKVGEKYYRCRISFATQHLKERFFSLGIIPRKSLVLTYPMFLDESLHRHFIRGYFDGDGSMYKSKSKKDISVSLLGTKDFLYILNKHIPGLDIKNIRQRNNIFTLSFHSKQAFSFLDFIYNNSTIYLQRKYDKFKEIAPLYSDV